MSTNRISTGIDGLDELLGGGFIRGRTYLVAGEAGTGKTAIVEGLARDAMPAL